jgi:hypothetical protein
VARTLNRAEQIKQFHALGTIIGWIALVPFLIQVLASAPCRTKWDGGFLRREEKRQRCLSGTAASRTILTTKKDLASRV